MPAKIEIPLSKKKMFVVLAGSFIFTIIGVILVLNYTNLPGSANHGMIALGNLYLNPAVELFFGILFCVVFGFISFYFLSKFVSNKPGLTIDESGLTDNSSGVAIGRIDWIDVNEINVIHIQRQKMIMIYLKNPQVYIDKQTNYLKRKIMVFNEKIYKTPIIIPANGLKISFKDLITLIKEYYNRSKTVNN